MNTMTTWKDTAIAQSSAPTEANSLISVIQTMVTNPDIDLDRLERLLAMQERAMERQAKSLFVAAFADMQADLPEVVNRGKNTNTKATYAKWEDINAAVKPVLSRHGFALNFRIERSDSQVTVTAILSHVGGHSDTTTISLPVDTGPGRNAVQAVASSQSYAQRYATKAILNITSRDEDDDGNATGDSALYADAIRRINLCETVEELREWRQKHADGVASMVSAKENQQVVALYNTRLNKMKAKTNG